MKNVILDHIIYMTTITLNLLKLFFGTIISQNFNNNIKFVLNGYYLLKST